MIPVNCPSGNFLRDRCYSSRFSFFKARGSVDRDFGVKIGRAVTTDRRSNHRRSELLAPAARRQCGHTGQTADSAAQRSP